MIMKRTVLMMILALICAASHAQLMEQREQSQACLGYAERSWMKPPESSSRAARTSLFALITGFTFTIAPICIKA